MGYMTTVLILNDGFDQIEKHPEEFVEGIKRKMREGGTVGVGNHANPVEVMRSEHADYFRLFATWRNSITELDPYSRDLEALYEMFPDQVRSLIEQARNNLDRLESKLLIQNGMDE